MFLCLFFVNRNSITLFPVRRKIPALMQWLNINSRDLSTEELHIYGMRMLMLSWPWALFGYKSWIILGNRLEKNLQKINDCRLNNERELASFFFIKSVVLQNIKKFDSFFWNLLLICLNRTLVKLEVFWLLEVFSCIVTFLWINLLFNWIICMLFVCWFKDFLIVNEIFRKLFWQLKVTQPLL